MTDSNNWFKKFLDKINYIDDESDDEKSQLKSNSATMKNFPEYIFGELKKSLEENIYRKKSGEIVCPPQIIIFWSEDIDNIWRGAKRQALLEDLESVSREIISEMSGNVTAKPSAKIGIIELKPDMLIRDKTVRVETRWDVENSSGSEIEAVTEVRTYFRKPQIPFAETQNSDFLSDEKTVPAVKNNRQRFSIEIWSDGKKQTEKTFSQSKINIGRDSLSKGKVDLNLSNDSRIARHHAVLQIDDNDIFWITPVDDNPLSIDGSPVPEGQAAQVGENQEIQIIDFTLRLKNDKKL